MTVDAGYVTAVSNGTAQVSASVDTLNTSVTTQVQANLFTLHSDGITVLCPDAMVDDTGEIQGVVYTKRDRSGLESLIQNRDWNAIRTSCTSGIQDMVSYFPISTKLWKISVWDVSSVTNVERMFYNAGFSIKISVIGMSRMSPIEEDVGWRFYI